MIRLVAGLALLGLASAAAAQHGTRLARKDPEFDRLLELVKQAESDARAAAPAAVSAAAPDRARALLREALIKTDGLAGPDLRSEVSELRYRIGYVAWGIGDLRTAHDAWAKTEAYRERFDGDGHASTQAVRASLALAKAALGELKPASWLQEKVLRVRLETLPKDHKDVQAARQALAGTLWQMGDLDGALRLQDEAVAVLSATLKDDDPLLAAARQNSALLKGATGDFVGARALQEKALAVVVGKHGEESPEAARARLNLAGTLRALGDFAEAYESFVTARKLEEQAVSVLVKALPGEHPEVRRARLNLAATLDLMGDPEAALAVEEETLAGARKVLPEDHPDVLPIRLAIAATKFRAGDVKAARELVEKILPALRTRQKPDHPDTRSASILRIWCAAAMGERAVVISEAQDAVAVMCTALAAAKSRAARRQLAGRFRPVLDQLLSLCAGCDRFGFEGQEDKLEAFPALGASCLVLAETLRAAEFLPDGPPVITAQDLAARLPEGGAGVVFHVGLRIADLYPLRAAKELSAVPGMGRVACVPGWFALVLRRDGSVACVVEPNDPSGPSTVRLAADVFRAVAAGEANDAAAHAAAQGLRRLVLDPVLAAAPGCKRLCVTTEDLLAALPLDALPDERETFAGEQIRIVRVATLAAGLDRAAPGSRPSKPIALVAGGTAAEHAAVPAPPAGIEPGAADGQAGLERLARDGVSVRLLHLLASGDSPDAGRKSIRDLGPAEAMFPRLDPGTPPAGLPIGRLAGVLLPAVVTADQLAALPLAACELAVVHLPAPSTAAIEHAGRSRVAVVLALIGAGARAVVTSLWRASPEAERALLADLQERVLVKNEDPAEALWQARMSIARQPGAKWRDWAGWQITVR